jgi:hypothetical protein
MATESNIKKFAASDIEKYHKGLLSARERHELEKAALDDPFLADALEGYIAAGVNIAADLNELKKRLAGKIEAVKVVEMQPAKKFLAPFLKAAAMLVLIAGSGLLVYQFAIKVKKEELAQVKPATIEQAKDADSISGHITSTVGGKTSGLVTTANTAQEQPSVKDNKITATRTKQEEQVASGNITTTETANAVKKLANENAPAGAVTQPGGIAPAKADEKEDPTERPVSKEVTDKITVRKETKAGPAIKQETERDAKKNQAYQQPDDTKNRRPVTANRQADDGYYHYQQMNTFRGRVTDASNTGLPFANVTNLQDNVGIYTDVNGNFILTSTDSVLNVQVRSLGYDNNNVQLRKNVVSNQIIMQEDRKVLSEVVLSTKKPNAAAHSKDAGRKLIEPEPVDGWSSYDSYLANNLNVPDEFKQQKPAGNNTVDVSFEVDKNGNPVNIRVEKSLCSSCDQEAIRLIKEGPKWKRNVSKKGRAIVTITF